MESDPRTLTFFVNDIEQRQYITHIPTAVRFWSYIFRKGSQFKILRFDRLASPKAKHESGSHGWKWGSRWKCEEGGV
ncbi:MAG: hypothetical protein EZS28_043408 [Streblomastix strix]|uniref:Uncharacterized protein n=1 Tax=Streblomastix strix TaxID=222440 RepID=A0A5J4TUI4_9EUKA|nr:MAG: hypothetical protein EZS28_043408 [Streblomastix strix]